MASVCIPRFCLDAEALHPATVVYPRVESWMRAAARAEQVAIEAALAREARVNAYLAERRKRRARAKVEQFAFDFESASRPSTIN